ncbi:DUF1294 domain-containing protein [Gallaecimonas sp. GXIMD1310]|uniref:DUF1294 domain-containing protein n=1 Tax=Gallaecimonas sp. GXIMD1310 TaxID=3131926 RepID=UPI003247C33C
MRFQGKITQWHDEKGFGFVQPNGGGPRAFVHVSAFKHSTRRPADGEVIFYELTRDSQNRYRAENIQFAPHSQQRRKRPGRTTVFSKVLLASFFAGLTGLVVAAKLPAWLLALYALMSLVTFVAYAIDKSAAQKGRWRTPERTLQLMALVGGWPGALLAQSALRHKSQKKAFKTTYWATVVINLLVLLWLQTDKGNALLKHLLDASN